MKKVKRRRLKKWVKNLIKVVLLLFIILLMSKCFFNHKDTKNNSINKTKKIIEKINDSKKTDTNPLDSIPVCTLHNFPSIIEHCIEWGRELLLLLVLDYCINNHVIDSMDLSCFNEMNINLSRAEIHKQMEKRFRLESFLLVLFETSFVSYKEALSEREKCQIEAGIISSFFLSNFAPEKKFNQYFKEAFDSFYLMENGGCEIDYRFATLAYLSEFNIKAETNHRETGEGLFHAEVNVGNLKDNLQFVYN